MAVDVNVWKVVTDYSLEDQEFPYTITVFATDISDNTPLTATLENNGVTFATWEDFYDHILTDNDWTVNN